MHIYASLVQTRLILPLKWMLSLFVSVLHLLNYGTVCKFSLLRIIAHIPYFTLSSNRAVPIVIWSRYCPTVCNYSCPQDQFFNHYFTATLLLVFLHWAELRTDRLLTQSLPTRLTLIRQPSHWLPPQNIWLISLQPPPHAGSSLADFSTLTMEAIRSSETSVYISSTRRHIPEDGIRHRGMPSQTT
jgi:hypothetical protein